MKLRSRRTLAIAGCVAALAAGTGAAVAHAQDSDAQTETEPAQTDSEQTEAGETPDSETRESYKDALLDDVASRLGIERSELDAAVRDIALDEVDWALENGFISEDEASELRERIEAGTGGLRGLHHFGFGGPGFGFHGFGLGHLGSLDAAADYLELSETELRDALESQTLAEIAEAQGKSVDGLEQALLDARQERLDEAVADDEITREQANALLDRYQSTLDDVVNGRSPYLSELADSLGVELSELEAAFEDAALARVDQALEEGEITEEQADELRERIQSGAGFALGPGLGCGRGFGEGRPAGDALFGGGRFDGDRSARQPAELVPATFA